MEIPNQTENPQPKDNTADFEKIVGVLHNKSRLSSLRTYQGDMAEFIKEKNESVFSIADKERRRKEKEEKTKDKNGTTPAKGRKQSQPSFTIILFGLALIAVGSLAFFYASKFMRREPLPNVVIETDLIPYNNVSNLFNISKENLGEELQRLAPESGISLIKVFNNNGSYIEKAPDFFRFLGITLSGVFERALRDKYALGIILQNEKPSPFLILTVNDFGNAFSAMLDWEKSLDSDLNFLNPPARLLSSTASTTSATSTPIFPIRPETFVWKDVIVKNKDTRSLVNKRDQARLVYTFLDKNTLLIANSTATAAEISYLYASRAIVK